MTKYKRRYYSQQHHFSKKLLIIPIIICLGIGVFSQWTRIQLAIKGYNFTEQSMILALEDEIIQKYLENKKINNLDSWKQYNNDGHYQEYIFYQNTHTQTSQEDIITYIDTFFNKNYDQMIALHYPTDILSQMIQKASLNDFEYIIQQKLDYRQTQHFLSIRGSIYTDLKDYIISKKEPLDAVLSISYPFINSQNKVTRTYQILDPSSYTTLIKKGFQIASDYVPDDLVTPELPFSPECNNKQLRKDAANALKEMYQDALKEDLHLAINSAYRSYQQQKDIYNEYHQKYDDVTANGLVAIPGSSEHQLGLGVDLTSQSVIDGTWRFFGDTKEYKWVVDNAYQYGYILRYPSHQSTITGTANEPWHFRYVGKDIAKIMHQKNWILEDYILHYGLSSDYLIQTTS